MKRRFLLVAFAVVLTIFAFVSCSNEITPQAEDKLGSITFGDNSRAIGYRAEYSEEIENLYWYYTAVKLDDGYKTGEKNGYTPVALDSDSNPSKGIQGKTLNSDGFSYGYWKIELRGFSSTTSTDENAAAYKATVDNFLVSKDTNVATALIEMAPGAKTVIKFSEEGITLEEGNITKDSVFSLTVKDSVDEKEVGKVGTEEAVYTIPEDGKKVTITGLKYTPNTGTDITGTHEMVFTLTQTLSNKNNTVASYDIIAATYTLKYIVNQGTTVTIFGSLSKNDDTGAVSINGIQSVPELVISKAIPVDSESVDDTNKIATVSSDTTINYGDFSVTYPAGAKISTASGSSDSTLSEDKKTSDTTIKFEYKGNNFPAAGESGTITLAGSDTSEQFDLGLTASKGQAEDNHNNDKLITISKKVGANKQFEDVYHDTDKLERLENAPNVPQGKTLDDVVNKESYYYNQEDGTLTLYLYHASPIYLITKNPVATDGKKQYYKLSEAVTAAAASGGSGEVKLLNNLNLNEAIEITSSIELDMNNKVIDLVTVDGTTGSVTVSGNGTISVINRNSEQKDFITGVERKSYNGNCSYYPTFEKALASASNGDTITLDKNDDLTTSYTPDVSLTINLNEKTLTVSNDAVVIVKSGTITVTGATDGQSNFIQAAGSSESSINRTYYPRAVSVTRHGSTNYYATIEDAMTAASDNAVVTLLKNVTISKPITVAGNITLNLAGKTITSSGDNLIYVSSGKLSVSGAADSQTEFVQGAKGSSAAIDGDYSPRVARVGSYYYATFEEAVNGAADGDTISLLSSVALSSPLVLNKNLTIELNNKTVSIKSFSSKTDVFTLSSKDDSYTVTVKNGKIETADEANTNINDVFAVGNNAVLNLDGMEIDAYAFCGIFLINQANPATVTIKNSKIKGMNAYGVGTNATEPADKTFADLTITDSTIETSGTDQDNTGLLVNVPSSVTISGSTISGQRQGVILRGTGSNAVKISSSTIKATGDGTGSYGDKSGTSSSSAWGNGNNIALAALVIGNAQYPTSGYARPTSVELDDVAIELAEGYQGKHIWVVQQSDANPVEVDGDIGPGWTSNSEKNGAKYPTAKVNGESFYGTLQEAINSATENCEIELCQDFAGVLVINGKTLTMDFNGYTVRGGIGIGCANNGYYNNDPAEGSTVVFKDSGSNGGVVNAVENSTALAIKGKSTVKMEGGSFIYDGSGDSSMVILLEDSTLKIDGGSVENKSTGSCGYCIKVNGYYYGKTTANITIGDGKFSTCATKWGYLIYVHDKESTLNLTIDGGEYDTKGTWGYLASKPSSGKITVNDGVFQLGACGQVFDVMNKNYSGYNSGTPVGENNNIEINGGVFTIGEGTGPDIRGFVYCNNTLDNVYGYVPKSLKLNGGKINCNTIHSKILEESNCTLEQDAQDPSYYIVTPKNSN